MTPDLVVRPCSHEAAKHAVMRWHYSQSMPAGKLVRFGVWEDQRFIGTAIYSRGASPYLAVRYDLDQTECVELARVALRDHATHVTQIVASSLRQLKTTNRRLRLVVSFADANRGHHGGIYQAGNWTYAGRTNPKFEYRDDTGRVYHDRTVSKKGWVMQYGERTAVPTPADLTAVRLEGKHRYLYPLDRAMRRKVVKLAQPYPSADEVSTVRHPTTGGEVPVRPRPSALTDSRQP